MKYSTLSIIICLLILSPQANAQNNFGLRAGVNLNDIRVADSQAFPESAEQFSPMVGYHFGIFGEFPIGWRWVIRPELLFQRKGARNDYSPSGPFFMHETELYLYYFSFPVFFQYRLGHFALEAGPEFGFRTHARFGIESRGRQPDEIYDQQAGLGMAIGASYIFGRFQLGLRYTHGLVKLSSDPRLTDINGVPLPEQPRLYNQALQASLGVVLIQE